MGMTILRIHRVGRIKWENVYKSFSTGVSAEGVLQQMLLLPFPPLKATSLHLLFCSHTPLQAAFLL